PVQHNSWERLLLQRNVQTAVLIERAEKLIRWDWPVKYPWGSLPCAVSLIRPHWSLFWEMVNAYGRCRRVFQRNSTVVKRSTDYRQSSGGAP
ncbi:hypothetical protein CEXT_566491, partial [Caerostris extrusa]